MKILSEELRAFFEVEERNAVQMAHDARDVSDIPPPPTLGSAIDSLAQAPADVIDSWFTANCNHDLINSLDDRYHHAWDIIQALIEMLQLLANEGHTFQLEDVEYLKKGK